MTIVKCLYCKKEFPKKPSAIKRRPNHFCCPEHATLYFLKKNNFVIKDDYAELHIETKREEKPVIILIDKEDIERINFTKWSLKYDKTVDNYYVYAWERNNYKNRKRIILHRFLTNCPDDMQVDHINRDTKDNRKSNLRICTQVENANNKGFYKNNTTGYKNICINNKNGGYRLEIKRNKQIVLKQFSKNLQELVKIRDEFLANEKNGTQIKEETKKDEPTQLKLQL